MQSVYEAAGGDEGLRRLAEAWHSSETDFVYALGDGYRTESDLSSQQLLNGEWIMQITR